MTIKSLAVGLRELHPDLRRRAVAGFILAYLAIQIVVPALKLAGPDDHPFGWQMYSTVGNEKFELSSTDGSTETIDPTEYVLRLRTEIDYSDTLPPLLCNRFPNATTVRVSSPMAGTEEFHQCRR